MNFQGYRPNIYKKHLPMTQCKRGEFYSFFKIPPFALILKAHLTLIHITIFMYQNNIVKSTLLFRLYVI